MGNLESTSRLPYSAPSARLIELMVEERLMSCNKKVSGQSGCAGGLDKS